MKEFVLNESKVRTTNSFHLNNIKVNLSISDNYEFGKFKINNSDIPIEEDIIHGNLTGRVGLTFDKYYKINIRIDKVYEEPLVLEYNFVDESLIDNINIHYEENSFANIIILYKGNKNNFHNLNLFVTGNKLAKGNITLINLLSKESSNIFEITTNIRNNASITTNIIDLGGKNSINNLYGKLLEEKSTSEVNSIYIGEDSSTIDLNYYVENIGEKSVNKINVEGCLKSNATKHFKGTIDFVKGCKESIGEENENCILLGDNIIARALPIMLAGEEDVIGSHGESTGKIDNNKLYYLMTKGFKKNEAEKLIIMGNFNKIISKIPVEEIRNIIEEEINNRI